MKLLKVDTIDKARAKLFSSCKKKVPETERISASQGLGRILAEDIPAGEPVPAFRRSTVDGYAVMAQNTQGVTESIPVFLEIIEAMQIGCPPKKEIQPGQCTYVPTGGMIPEGTDAMVMIEYCEPFDQHSVAVYDAVSPGRNIIGIGEDIQTDSTILKKGTKLRPQEIGVLAACGVETIAVYKPWKITVISTGDELVGTGTAPKLGQIRDINTYTISAVCAKYGLQVVKQEVLKDQRELLTDTVRQTMENSDLVAISGGSSQGDKDYTAQVLDELGTPGVFTHGIALKPGKPTILGYDKKTETILMGLPGHPAAAMLVFQLMAVWLYQALTGQKEEAKTLAEMEVNVPGAPGKSTCLLLELQRKESGYIARPILGKSGLMTTLTRADGYTMIDMNKEGLKAGETVEVTLL